MEIKGVIIKQIYFFYAFLTLLFIIALGSTAWAYFLHSKLYSSNNLTVSFLDIGQGDAIFIQAPNGAQVLIDGGAPDTGVIQKLKLQMPLFDKTIDLVIATHPDNDHIGGLVDVFRDYQIQKYMIPTSTQGDSAAWTELLSAVANENGMQQIRPLAGMRIILDDARHIYIDILHPFITTKSQDTNEHSVIAKLVYGETEFMLTGDATRANEHQLVTGYLPSVLDSDVLKLGHHGSKTSSSVEFLRTTSPNVAVVSAGKNNRYGHPAPEIMQFVSALKIPTISTQTSGTITFISNGFGIKKRP